MRFSGGASTIYNGILKPWTDQQCGRYRRILAL